MPTLPPTINVNWYITCTKCKHYTFVSVDWFKNARAAYGKAKPLTWGRLICTKCRGRQVMLSRALLESRREFFQFVKNLDDDRIPSYAEVEESIWSTYSSEEDGREAEPPRNDETDRTVYDFYCVDGIRIA